MSKNISYKIAGEKFPSKSSLQERIKGILYSYEEGQYLTTTDFKFMYEVLKLHPEFELKNGIGIKEIFIKQNPQYKNNRCFWLVRLDGSSTDFSYIECLKPTSHEKKFRNACRVAIEPYTQVF